jgi:PAS domain S-box-containing protein
MHAIGLRTKLLIGTVGTISLFGMLLILIIHIIIPQKIEIELCKRWVHFSKAIARESIDFLLQGKTSALKANLLNHVKIVEDIEYISVLDNNGNVLAHTYEKMFPEDLKKANVLQPGQKQGIQYVTTERGNVFDIAVPILKGELGVVRLGFSEDTIRECIADITMVLVWIIIGASIPAGILSIFLSTVVAKPVTKLITGVKAIGIGDPGYRVNIKTNDEIGKLADSFNDMVEDLNKAKNELIRTNTELKSEIEGLWRSLVENAPDIIFTVDREGRIIFINQIPEGLTAEDVLGTKATDYVAPEYRETVRKSIQKVFETGDNDYYEISARGPHDSKSWYSTRLGPVKHEDELEAVMLITRDITGQKKTEKMVLEIEERERERIGHDLHDDLGQIFTALAFQCMGLEGKLKAKSSPEAEDVAEITKLIDNAKNHLGLIAQGFLPVETNKKGLVTALKELTYKTESMFGISCAFKCDKPVLVYNKAAILNMYRIAQEAVNNAVKYAKSDYIEICLNKDNDKITMIVKDNGTGIPEIPGRQSGMGIKIMNYRAKFINAALDIQSDVNKGTQVICIFIDRSNRGM